MPKSAQSPRRRTGTYHRYVGVLFEEFGDLGKLVLEVVDPDVADVGALGRLAVQESQHLLVVLL